MIVVMDILAVALGIASFAILARPDRRDRPDMTFLVASISGADLFGLIVSVLVMRLPALRADPRREALR